MNESQRDVNDSR